MKVFFIGSVEFSKILFKEVLLIEEVQIVGVATKQKSNYNADHADLSDIAILHDIPYRYVKDINSKQIIDWVISLEPDVIFCFGWSSIIKKKLLELTPKGVIGYHPTELPQNRGRHPIIWALVLGLDRTGSTFFRMDEGADSGDVLNQRIVNIEIEDNASTLYEKLLMIALEQVKDFVPKMVTNTETYFPQDHSKANYWRKRGIPDGRIDFRCATQTIYNQVRALSKPYVGAHIQIKDEMYSVWTVGYGEAFSQNIVPGTILQIEDNKILVKSGDSSIWLLEHGLDKEVLNIECFYE